MSAAVLTKLAALLLMAAIGYAGARLRWLGAGGRERVDAARVLSDLAFYLFVPALLFRTSARLDLTTLPWGTLVAFFVPALTMLMAVYFWQRRTERRRGAAGDAGAPAVRAISATFGNSVQIGIPVAAALFGEAGLGIHLALVSVHALALLTLPTALAELDLARARGADAHLASTLRATVRHTLVHPVVLPLLAGLAWQLTGLALPAVIDELLLTLGAAVVPLCMVLIGVSLATYGVGGAGAGAARLVALKLLALPALVLALAWGLFGLHGLALQVVVMMAALPVGNNALLFAQRYRTHEAEATTAIVASTALFMLTAPLWLALLTRLTPG